MHAVADSLTEITHDIDNNGNLPGLSAQRIKDISQCSNLEDIVTLEMRIDSQKLYLGNIYKFVPNLRYLKLSHSIIPAIRDLGASFANLEVLWMSRCCLRSLEGIESIKNLQELYLSFNEISDINVCGSLKNLEILDLECNKIESRKSIAALVPCEKLSNLTLEHNAVVKQFKSYQKFRNFIQITLPSVKFLDNVSTQSKRTHKDVDADFNFDDEWGFINQIMEEFDKNTDDPNYNYVQRTASQFPKPKLAFTKPASSLCVSLEEKRRCVKVDDDGILHDCEASCSNFPADRLANLDNNESNLTGRYVICGDIGKALRRRRHSIETPRQEQAYAAERDAAASKTDDATNESQYDDEITLADKEAEFASTEELQNDCITVLKELEIWRSEFAMKLKKNLVSGINIPDENPKRVPSLKYVALPLKLRPISSIRNEEYASLPTGNKNQRSKSLIKHPSEKVSSDPASQRAFSELETFRAKVRLTIPENVYGNGSVERNGLSQPAKKKVIFSSTHRLLGRDPRCIADESPGIPSGCKAKLKGPHPPLPPKPTL